MALSYNRRPYWNNQLKKITVITTGGTIGSIFNSDAVTVDPNATRVAKEVESAAEALDCLVEIISPLNKHSESFNPADWGLILGAIAKACASDAEAVVVTHGSDTMAYTVAAAVAFSHLWNKKICFTGSFYAPEHPMSDAALNLQAALAFSLSPNYSNGVFVAFRQGLADNMASIFAGSAIKPMGFDSVVFEPLYGSTLMQYTSCAGLTATTGFTATAAPCLKPAGMPTQEAIDSAKQQVACLHLYPGIDKALLQAAAKGRRVLVIELYHSGTGPAGVDSALLRFIAELSTGGRELQVLMGAFPRQHIALPYQSTLLLKQAGAQIYADLPAHFLQVFALLAVATGKDRAEISQALSAFEL